MSNPRPDLGPRLRRVLADQLAPPSHNIPVHSELGAQIRRSFMPPGSGQVFAAFDGSQLEARLVAAQSNRCTIKRELYGLIYGGRTSDGYNLRRALDPTPQGGTRKIAELPRVCLSPDHNPPAMMVYEAGIWEHVCPVCHARQVFTVSPPTL